jgi:hypothetical protein
MSIPPAVPEMPSAASDIPTELNQVREYNLAILISY